MLIPGQLGKLKVNRIEVIGAILQNGPVPGFTQSESYEAEDDFEAEDGIGEDEYVSPEDIRKMNHEVVLPKMDCSDELKEGDEVEVFLFTNKDGYMEATTHKPLLTLGQVKLLTITGSNISGAFADIGLREDLFIPPNEQRLKALPGKQYLVTMQYDEERTKLIGSTNLPKYMRYRFKKYKKGDELEIILAEKTDDGMRVIANQETWAFLPYSNTFRHVRLGETYKAWVSKIEPREMYVSLQQDGFDQVEKSAGLIIDYLRANNGYARLTDHSDPAEIELRLHMSKKTFKRAIGYLQKKDELVITKRGIKIPKEKR